MLRLNKNQIEQIRFLEESTGELIFDPLLILYRQQEKEVIQKMISEVGLKNFNQVSRLAHSLKSSAAQLGLETVSHICLQLETEGRKNPQYNFMSQFEILKNESDQSMKELLDYLSLLNTRAA